MTATAGPPAPCSYIRSYAQGLLECPTIAHSLMARPGGGWLAARVHSAVGAALVRLPGPAAVVLAADREWQAVGGPTMPAQHYQVLAPVKTLPFLDRPLIFNGFPCPFAAFHCLSLTSHRLFTTYSLPVGCGEGRGQHGLCAGGHSRAGAVACRAGAGWGAGYGCGTGPLPASSP